MGLDSTTRGLLAGAGWLSEMPPSALETLGGHARREALAAGSVLYHQGDAPDDLAVVVRGRLRAVREGGDGATVHREMGRGEPVGEVGIMTGEPRAATVVAVRDTEVVRIPAEAVLEALAQAPSTTRHLARVIIERLREPVRRPAATAVATVMPLNGSPPEPVVTALVDALAREGITAAVPGEAGVAQPADAAELGALVDAAEADGSIAVLPADGREPWWDEVCGRQADTLLLLGTGRQPRVSAGAGELLAHLEEAGVTPARELVLSHPGSTRQPRGSAAWRDAVEVARHHHVRSGDEAHHDRLARHLLGRTTGLVLSGGGARAMAHLGAYRALREADHPIDHVGGSSIGGVVAAQIATEADPGKLIELDRREFQAADFGRRITLPVISLLSIRHAIELFEHLFGDLDLADTWVPCFVTTVDFSECALVLRDRGPAALWARATASPPGLWPPVVDERGHLAVDGAVLDNLPVEPMLARGAARTVAVNVSSRTAAEVDPARGEVTSWTEYVRRLVRDRGSTYPNIAGLLMRLGLVTSLPAQDRAVARADLCIEPDVAEYGLASYGPFDDIVDAGYRATVSALAQGSPAQASTAG